MGFVEFRFDSAPELLRVRFKAILLIFIPLALFEFMSALMNEFMK